MKTKIKKTTQTIYSGKCLNSFCNNDANEKTGLCKECYKIIKAK